MITILGKANQDIREVGRVVRGASEILAPIVDHQVCSAPWASIFDI